MIVEKFTAAFAEAPIGAAVIDRNDAIVEVNTAFADWVGYDPGALRGRSIVTLLAEDGGTRRTASLFADLAAFGRACRGCEQAFVRPDGSVARGTIAAWPLSGGELERADRIIAVIHDTSPDDAVTAEISLAIAHNVRNPLAAIGGALTVIRDRLDSDAPEREILTDISTRLQEFDELVDDLVLLAQPPPVRRHHVAIIAALQHAAESLPVALTVTGDDATVHADPALVQRGLRGLIDSFGNDERPITAHVSVDGGVCHIEVTGGAATTTASSVERYMRRAALRIALAYRIARAHGGELELPRPGTRGLTLTVSLRVTTCC